MENIETYTSLPFRDSIQLLPKLFLVIWSDAQFVEHYYQLAELEKEDKEQQKKWFKVLASFTYADELFKYLTTASLDRFYS